VIRKSVNGEKEEGAAEIRFREAAGSSDWKGVPYMGAGRKSTGAQPILLRKVRRETIWFSSLGRVILRIRGTMAKNSHASTEAKLIQSEEVPIADPAQKWVLQFTNNRGNCFKHSGDSESVY